MKKNPTIFQGLVKSVSFPNKGTVIPVVDASAAGFSVSDPSPKPVHVKNVLPGQTVEVFQSNHQHKRREGTLQRLIAPAPYEIPSPCPHAASCGGCSYQTVPYSLQLQWKSDMVLSLLDIVLDRAEYTYLPILSSPLQYGYRNKMEFSFGDEYKNGPLTLGLHKRGAFHDIVPVTECQIVDPDFRLILQGVLEYFTASGDTYHSTRTHSGYLRHLVLRRSFRDHAVLINLVTSSDGTLDSEAFVRHLTALPLSGHIAGILHTTNDSLADIVRPDQVALLYGEPFLTEELLGLSFRLSPFSFFQTNTAGTSVLYQTVLDMAGDLKDQTVFDLYCGTGTIAQIIAHAGAKRVLGIELIEEAVEAAKENARLNGLENCTFLAGDVLKLVDTLQEHPDLIVLDPPRDGIHPKALPKILAYQPKRLIYVSCKPTSLVRDLPALKEAGYHVQTVRTVDMFPGTVHVETVCLLVRRNGLHVDIDVDVEEMLQEKRGQATYAQIKDYVLEQNGLKVSSLYISQVKRKCGLDVSDSYNKSKSEDATVPQCPPEKEEAIMNALRHFGVV